MNINNNDKVAGVDFLRESDSLEAAARLCELRQFDSAQALKVFGAAKASLAKMVAAVKEAANDNRASA